MDLSIHAYMRAFLRLHMVTPKAASALSNLEVQQSFAFLPDPDLAYPEWLAMFTETVEDLSEPGPVGTKADLVGLLKDPALQGIVSSPESEETEED